MFTRRHYKILARLISESQNLDKFTNILIDYFEHDNDRFSKTKFLSEIARLKGSPQGVMKDVS